MIDAALGALARSASTVEASDAAGTQIQHQPAGGGPLLT